MLALLALLACDTAAEAEPLTDPLLDYYVLDIVCGEDGTGNWPPPSDRAPLSMQLLEQRDDEYGVYWSANDNALTGAMEAEALTVAHCGGTVTALRAVAIYVAE